MTFTEPPLKCLGPLRLHQPTRCLTSTLPSSTVIPQYSLNKQHTTTTTTTTTPPPFALRDLTRHYNTSHTHLTTNRYAVIQWPTNKSTKTTSCQTILLQAVRRLAPHFSRIVVLSDLGSQFSSRHHGFLTDTTQLSTYWQSNNTANNTLPFWEGLTSVGVLFKQFGHDLLSDQFVVANADTVVECTQGTTHCPHCSRKHHVSDVPAALHKVSATVEPFIMVLNFLEGYGAWHYIWPELRYILV